MSDYKDYGFEHDGATHNMGYQLATLIGMLDRNVNQLILDLGCGNGYFAKVLLDNGFNVYGTDASEKGIAIAKMTNPDRFFVQDLASGELPPELSGLRFDTIVSTEVIEHLYDPEGFIAFCRKQLQPGGQLIITTPYHGYLKNLMLSVFNKWDTHMSPLWLGGHIKLWSRRTLSRAIVNGGFEVTHFAGCGRFPYFWKSMVIKAKVS